MIANHIRLQADVPDEVMNKLHARIRKLKNKHGEVRSQYELTNEEKNKLAVLSAYKGIRPNGEQELQAYLEEMRLVLTPWARKFAKYLKVPVLTTVAIKALDRFTDEELAKMIEEHIHSDEGT